MQTTPENDGEEMTRLWKFNMLDFWRNRHNKYLILGWLVGYFGLNGPSYSISVYIGPSPREILVGCFGFSGP